MSVHPCSDILLVTFSVGEEVSPNLLELLDDLQKANIASSAIIVSETACLNVPEGVGLLTVGVGSKLSKIRHLLASGLIGPGTHLCVVDSDVRLEIDACTDLIRRTMDGGYGVGFGVVEVDGGTRWLDRCIHLDKRLSHRFWRPLLHKLGIGITVPGQFIVYGPALLAASTDGVETFLDDLYFGLKCRRAGLAFLRVSEVVCHESGRTSWTSLLNQRIRWMKGLFSLTGAAIWKLGGWRYCVIHYTLYHGVPMLFALALTLLASSGAWTLATALVLLCTVTLAGGRMRACPVAVMYIIAFPLIHLLATFGAFFPIPMSRLRKR